MNPHLQRGLLLYEQSRYDLAVPEFQQALASQPQDAYTRAILALTLCQLERYREAESEVVEALKLDAALPFAHYARAFILNERHDYANALKAIEEAVQLDPDDADYRALKSQVLYNTKKWEPALAAAEQGLALDPAHVACTNLRAMALVNLGRNAEAGQTIDAALARNPENSTTHANQGWTLLHAGEHQKALEHFRESLRLDPGNEWARQGIVEALKARHFIYSLMLKYFLWMSRQSTQMQWGIILVGVFGMRGLRALGKSNPEIAPFILPIQILYVLFVFLSWTAEPLFNLLLRLNKFGRMVLDRKEIVASNWVGGFVAVALLFLLGALVIDTSLLWGAFVFGFSVIPLAAIFKCARGWPKWTMLAYTLVVVGAGVTVALVPILAAFRVIDREETKSLLALLMGTFFIGILLAGWVANFLMMQRVRR